MPVSMPADTPRNRIILWSAHQMLWFWIVVVVHAVADDIVPGNATLKVLDVASVAGMAWMIYARHRHGLTLRLFCAIAVPLDGPGRAATRAATLRWAHRTFSRRYIIVQVAGVVAAYIVSLTLLEHVSLFIYWIGGLGVIEAYLMRVHEPLEPWCPYCDWDDGGDHEVVPDPVPPSGAVVVT